MLRKILSKPLFSLISPQLRKITYQRDSNIWLPETIEDLKAHMEKHNPDLACVYFHANWNPFMKKINAKFEKVCIKHPEIMQIWVDCNKTPLIKYYYDAKVEPTFVLLINGGELCRIVGDDWERLEEMYKKYF